MEKVATPPNGRKLFTGMTNRFPGASATTHSRGTQFEIFSYKLQQHLSRVVFNHQSTASESGEELKV